MSIAMAAFSDIFPFHTIQCSLYLSIKETHKLKCSTVSLRENKEINHCVIQLNWITSQSPILSLLYFKYVLYKTLLSVTITNLYRQWSAADIIRFKNLIQLCVILYTIYRWKIYFWSWYIQMSCEVIAFL